MRSVGGTGGARAERPDDAVVLAAWEHAQRLERPWRELALLEMVEPGTPDDLARLPIGERDRRLLRLRISLLGRRMDAEADCVACGDRLELELDADHLLADLPASDDRTVTLGEWTAHVRAPDSTDVAAALRADDPDGEMIVRCTDLGAGHLSEDQRDAVIARMAELDPASELVLDARCPGCGQSWHEPIDPAAFVILEIDRLATRLLREVDQLARAYGWRESDVLGLSAARRRAYLELASR